MATYFIASLRFDAIAVVERLVQGSYRGARAEAQVSCKVRSANARD